MQLALVHPTHLHGLPPPLAPAAPWPSPCQVLEAQGQTAVPPADRQGLHPLAIPLAQQQQGGSSSSELTCLLRWPEGHQGMELPVVSQARGGTQVGGWGSKGRRMSLPHTPMLWLCCNACCGLRFAAAPCFVALRAPACMPNIGVLTLLMSYGSGCQPCLPPHAITKPDRTPAGPAGTVPRPCAAHLLPATTNVCPSAICPLACDRPTPLCNEGVAMAARLIAPTAHLL